MKVSLKKSSLMTLAMWAVSFILSFKIPPGNKFIWLPDTLLLTGFWPLFFGMKARWFWLVFGICNMFIGFVLYVALFFPAADLARYNLAVVKVHMEQYHPCLAWFLVGLISTIIGLVILIKCFCVWLYNYVVKARQKPN